MTQDWSKLVDMTQGQDFKVKKVQLTQSAIQVEGDFELPPLAKLSNEDQVFIVAFIQASGSIKEMERLFGVSYPTIKARLARLKGSLPLLSIECGNKEKTQKSQALDALNKGEISVEDALRQLESK